MIKIETPAFASEREEAEWWFANQSVITDAFEKEHGISRQNALAEEYAEQHAAEILALVMDESDVKTALERAAAKGVSPRDYVRQLGPHCAGATASRLISAPNREWLRGLPKCELHLHLEGTVQPETLVALSARHDTAPLTLDQARGIYVYEHFLGFLMAFKQVSERLQTAADYELITYEMIHRLSQQGVRHAEVYISFGIILRFKPYLTVEEVTAAIERGRIRGEQEFGTTVYWIIDAVRHFGVEEAAVVFGKAADLKEQYPSIVGIGIGGDEARGPAADFRDLYADAKRNGLHLLAHAGESVSAESIWSAVNIGAERIGHALTAVDDPELLDMLAQKQIPLELNVTSNLRTGCCRSLATHPVRHYFERGLMITLNSDDPPMFGADLLDEYELVQREFEFTDEQMRELASNSVEASFLPPDRKLALLAEVEHYR